VTISSARARKILRGVSLALVLLYFAFITAVLALRYIVTPNVGAFHSDIERLLADALKREVAVGQIRARWAGFAPGLILEDVRVLDAEKKSALTLSYIEARVSWLSIPTARLKLSLLDIGGARLHLKRDAQGRFFVAGIPVDTENSGGGFSDWLFRQRRIRFHGATLLWDDAARRAPTLELKDFNVEFDNGGIRHRFGLTARPPKTLASELDVRGEFDGKDWNAPTGRVYVDLDHANLEALRPWADFPVELPRGRGAARVWAGISEGRLETLTVDAALVDTSVRLGKDLPMLDLSRLSGRIRLRRPASGFVLDAVGVELTTRPEKSNKALKIDPQDFHVEWKPGEGEKLGSGRVTAERVDLGVLAALSEYIPLDETLRRRLRGEAPQGILSDVRARWDDGARASYSLKMAFDGLGKKAADGLPGFSGVSGALDANEDGGTARLRSKGAVLELRKVFPDAAIAFDTLDADLRWKKKSNVLETELLRAEFSSPDAAGEARGVYRYAGEGSGSIDMTATLSRADARAVWRYIPAVVNADARYWLRDSLLAGASDDARLTLKGDLDDFPFLDPQKGVFLVTVKAKDVTVDYGKDWPKITGIFADLRFEGNGMLIDAQRGRILGAKLEKTRVTIPDFDAPVSTLYVKGDVSGPTSEFLKFVEQSPVARKIDHFTEAMRATGNGRLNIDLAIPLDEKRLDNSKIAGVYSFQNNEVSIDPGFPPIKKAKGALRFSGNDLRIPEISGVLFGGPLKIQGGKQADGRVLVSFKGSVDAARMRADSPRIAEFFSGSTPYEGEVRIDGNDAEVSVKSSLAGLASSLPAPFAKPAGQEMPLFFERKLLPPDDGRKRSADGAPPTARDQLSATLGDVLSLRILRSERRNVFVPDSGVLAVGLPLPEATDALNISFAHLDLDAWQSVLAPFVSSGSSPSYAFPTRPVVFRTPKLTFLGKDYQGVSATISNSRGAWKVTLDSDAANGELLWESGARNKLTARLKRLTLASPSSEAAAGIDASSFEEELKSLPDMEIGIEDFTLGSLRFGNLDVRAKNGEGVLEFDRILIKNPAAALTGSAVWRYGKEAGATSLDFMLDSPHLGRLFNRMSYPEIVRGGKARLEGHLSWKGAPVSIDYASLNGKMTLEAGGGQFLKVEPGVGKLLGLVSLQSLQRRITLDFRDIFGEGFAFDSISSKVEIRDGILRTDKLTIDGPSAQAIIRGETDIKRETQALDVKVLPDLGGTAALGVALVNPLAGIATLFAHKIMQNPLDQIFSLDYKVNGTWSAPVVEKVSVAPPPDAYSEPSVAPTP
jgi:uncharacterized protein (TIGR02099 family)